MSDLQFSERQRAVIAAALTLFSAVVIFGLVGWILVILGQLLSFFSGVLLPFVTAGLLALVLRPYYQATKKMVRFSSLAVVMVLVSIAIPFALFVVFFGGLLISQISGLLSKIPVWLDELRVQVQQRLPGAIRFWREHELGPRLQELIVGQSSRISSVLASVGGSVVSVGTGMFRSLAGALGWVVMPVYLVFFLISEPLKNLRKETVLPFLKPETREDVAYLARELVGMIVSFFRGQLLISFLQGALYAVGFLAVGLQYGLAIGMFMGFMNLIPYLGSMLGLMVSLPVAMFQEGGGLGHLAAVMGVIVVVQCVESYVLTPKIMGDRTGLHPMAIIFAIFFWGTALGGILGMILAIPLTAFFVVFWRFLRMKYIREML